MTGPLPIVFRDAHLVAINKPHGLLVHRSPIASDVSEFAVQILRDQIGQKVYPVHRLDRKTAGALLFALTEEINSLLQQQFQAGQVGKTYHAIVRGFAPDSGEIDYPLRREDGVLQEAFTSFRTIEKSEVPFSIGKHPTSRYSLIELNPQQGRMHQLRKHMAHIMHPIIGDRPYGCNKQNRFFKNEFEMNTMLLHASSIRILHPATFQPLTISAPVQHEFDRMLHLLNFEKCLNA